MINAQVNLTDNPEKMIDLSKLIEQVNQEHLPRIISSNKGDAVLLSKQDWDNLQETLYLQSIPGFVNNIREIEKQMIGYQKLNL